MALKQSEDIQQFIVQHSSERNNIVMNDIMSYNSTRKFSSRIFSRNWRAHVHRKKNRD